MNILFWNWKGFGKEDIVECFEKIGHTVNCIDDKSINERFHEEYNKRFEVEMQKKSYDFVFSINYRPIISQNCMKYNIKYISIVYDNPLVSLYSYTIVNSCNYIFLFDSSQYFELKNGGINTVYYMPLAVNIDRIDRMAYGSDIEKEFISDISFVGAMYNEKHNLFERLEGKLPSQISGYLDGIMAAQLKVYGEYFIQELLTKNVVDELQKAMPYDRNRDGIETLEYIFSDYFIGRKLAQMERHNLLNALSQNFNVNLYTHNKTPDLPKINNKGPVDYYDTMPYVFKYSKINLNISLRTIKKGIPLRAMDIMGCHGFLLSNYQEDFLRHFIDGEDFIYFESEENLIKKCKYYLQHDNERKQIEENGYGKIREFHNYTRRLSEILEIVLCS